MQLELTPELETEISLTGDKEVGRLRFGPKLESKYALHVKDTLQQDLRRFGLIGMLIYLLFAIPDYLLLPNYYLEAWLIRFGIVAPTVLALFTQMNQPWFKKQVYGLIILLIILVSGSILYIGRLSPGTLSDHTHTGVILVAMYINIVLRINFRHALFSSLLIFVMYVISLMTLPYMPITLLVHNIVVGFFACQVSLFANYLMTKEHRSNYLKSAQLQIDAAKLVAMQKELEALSLTDSLTGLANRRHFDMQFALHWQDAQRHRAPLSVLFIDVDYFKAYNDHFGHPAGDAALVAVANAINMAVARPRDLPARYGGEEFVCLLPETDQVAALTVAIRIQEQVKALHIEHGKANAQPYITVSIGLASASPGAVDVPQRLLKQADEALYKAKANGRNRIEMFQIG